MAPTFLYILITLLVARQGMAEKECDRNACASRHTSCLFEERCKCTPLKRSDKHNASLVNAFMLCTAKCVSCMSNFWAECCLCTGLCRMDDRKKPRVRYAKANRDNEVGLFQGVASAVRFNEEMHAARRPSGRQIPLMPYEVPREQGSQTHRPSHQELSSSGIHTAGNLSEETSLKGYLAAPQNLLVLKRRITRKMECWSKCDAVGARRWRLVNQCCECYAASKDYRAMRKSRETRCSFLSAPFR